MRASTCHVCLGEDLGEVLEAELLQARVAPLRLLGLPAAEETYEVEVLGLRVGVQCDRRPGIPGR
jgi:hypothetical protein